MGCAGSKSYDGAKRANGLSEQQVIQKRQALEQKMLEEGLVGPDHRMDGGRWQHQRASAPPGAIEHSHVSRSPGPRPQQQPGSPWGGPPRPVGRPRVPVRQSAPAGSDCSRVPLPQSNNLMKQPSNGAPSQVLAQFPPDMSFVFSSSMRKTKHAEGKLITTQHNEYRMGKKIGRGAQGKVKLVESLRDGRQFAAKMLMRSSLTKKRPGAKGALTPLELLHREISIMGRLSSPHVVNLYEVIDDPDQSDIYLIMELCGDPLMKGGPTEEPLGEREARLHFTAIAEGLLYCHSAGVLHRDVKPENLLRSLSDKSRGGPSVKLADFGVSSTFVPQRRRSSSGRPGGVDTLTDTAGTAAFHAPECITSSAETGGFSGVMADTWAVGVTLYFMVYGQCPFVSVNCCEDLSTFRVQLASCCALSYLFC
eukprot:COSAG02_NODE_208_length_29027_cov_27.870230_13_plen_422_part_00